MGFNEALVLSGAFVGGFVSGLTGFGTGLSALPLWLLVLAPVRAVPLVVVCSLVAQLATLPAIWRHIEWRVVAPFLVGGLLGVPLGTWLLGYVPTTSLHAGFGWFLIAYCTLMLALRGLPGLQAGGRLADAGIGLGGGVLGGLGGLSGALPTLWAGLRGWGKQRQRGMFQAFNTAILGFALVTQGFSGYLDGQFAVLLCYALPGTLAGAWLGRRIYTRLGDRRFNQVVLGVLLCGGIATVALAG
ncbi:MAG: sulfite exporter TauE/SafE family protein [Gammaproteobacteria bacterium]|nr:sulfite exporter TauE/SafE family protein [Gammaproteobacteria bacterium]